MTSAETSSIAIHPSQLNASQAVDQIGIKLNSHQVYQNTEQRLESMVPNNGDEMKDSPRDAGFESPLFHHHRPQSCQLYSRRELTWGQVEQQSTEIMTLEGTVASKVHFMAIDLSRGTNLL
jgi:hypothetical protein